MNQLKGTAKNLSIGRSEIKRFLRRPEYIHKARMMVNGQAVCLVTHDVIDIAENDHIVVSGTVRRGVLYARSYANGTRNRWGCRNNDCLCMMVSILLCPLAGLLALLNVLPAFLGLLVVLIGGTSCLATEFNEYRYKKNAKRALRRYRLGPPLPGVIAEPAKA